MELGVFTAVRRTLRDADKATALTGWGGDAGDSGLASWGATKLAALLG